MKNILIINPDNIGEEAAKNLKPRLAVRGVVFDQDKNVAVLPVLKHGYYKLPGGGIEEGEDIRAAFSRECMEEIGSDVEVLGEIGLIIEYRTKFSMIQTSYCYICKAVGERRGAAFTEHELDEGFEQAVWVPFEEAYKLISTSNPDNYSGGFIKERDTAILEAARGQINSI